MFNVPFRLAVPEPVILLQTPLTVGTKVMLPADASVSVPEAETDVLPVQALAPEIVTKPLLIVVMPV